MPTPATCSSHPFLSWRLFPQVKKAEKSRQRSSIVRYRRKIPVSFNMKMYFRLLDFRPKPFYQKFSYYLHSLNMTLTVLCYSKGKNAEALS
jgi:hypothetical protein